MRRHGLGFLVAVALCFVAVAIWTLTIGEVGVSAAAPSTPALPGFADRSGEIASVKVSRDGFSETFVHDGDNWLAADKGNYPAAAAKISQIVRSMADLTLVEPKTQRPELYPRLQVEDPGKGKSALVSVEDKLGKPLAELIVGKRRYDRLGAGNDGVYVRKPGDAQSWLARGSLDLSGVPSSWLDRQIVDLPEKRIAKVVLTQPDGATLVLSRTAPDAKFGVEGAAADVKFRSDTTTAEPAMALEAFELDDVAPAAKMPVPEKGVASASFTTFDGLTVDLRLLDRDKETWVAIKATGTGAAEAEAKRIDERVANWTYEIPSYKAERLKTKLADRLEPAKKTQ